MLSGGATPRRLYATLAGCSFRDRMDWGHVRLLWGDERCVPPTDAASSYRLTREKR
jgi:6-phosphogluconolactonase